jgi:hypothetical protein
MILERGRATCSHSACGVGGSARRKGGTVTNARTASGANSHHSTPKPPASFRTTWPSTAMRVRLPSSMAVNRTSTYEYKLAGSEDTTKAPLMLTLVIRPRAATPLRVPRWTALLISRRFPQRCSMSVSPQSPPSIETFEHYDCSIASRCLNAAVRKEQVPLPQ